MLSNFQGRWQRYVALAGMVGILLYIWWEFAWQHFNPVLKWFSAVITLVVIMLLIVREWLLQRSKPRR